MNRKRCNALGAALAAGLGYAVISPWASPPAWGQDAGALPHGFQTTPVLKSGKTAYGAPLVLPRTDKPEIISLIGVMEPGGRTALHQHPVPTFSYVIEGAITIQAEGQEVKTYQAGEAYLEAIGAWHQAFNKGDKPVKLLLLFVAEEGKPVTITKHQ